MALQKGMQATYSRMNVGMKPGHVGDRLCPITIESDNNGLVLFRIQIKVQFNKQLKPIEYILCCHTYHGPNVECSNDSFGSHFWIFCHFGHDLFIEHAHPP